MLILGGVTGARWGIVFMYNTHTLRLAWESAPVYWFVMKTGGMLLFEFNGDRDNYYSNNLGRFSRLCVWGTHKDRGKYAYLEG